ncbi:MAG: hypothetical protein DI598_14975 [Pseudopedobacter saltans]|uniref:Uncharacterized protein n=1 Tax=Pseudopedobacter saltans TaxID=151895 RepID=A0A2W5GEH1_9SPHI|nr:MAG: hypothetical protein DI598_14975 [Pseudopedobacter saltans]
MAKINSNVVTGSFGAKVTSRIAAVFIEFRKDGVTSAALLEALKVAKLQVDKSTITGTTVKIYPQSVVDLMEICSNFSGAIIGEKVGTKAFIGGTINLTESGAEQLQKDEYYNVQLTGLPEGVEADLYAIDTFHNAASFLSFSPIDVPANAPKYIDVANALFIAIPYGKLRSLEATHQNRQHVRYEADELEHIVKIGNPMTSNMEGVLTTGPINYYVLPIGQIQEVKLDLLEDGKAILVNRVYS